MIAPTTHTDFAPREPRDRGLLNFHSEAAVHRPSRARQSRNRGEHRPAVIPKVIVIINTTFGDCESLLAGISRYHRDHGGWDVFVDDGSGVESDPQWLVEQPWTGVISRTTTK